MLIGLTFGSLGLTMTALSPSYDFFLYYFTLAITPMVLLCGVFFPVSQLPPFLQQVSALLPLSHAIELARPLVNGEVPASRSAARVGAGGLRGGRVLRRAGPGPAAVADLSAWTDWSPMHRINRHVLRIYQDYARGPQMLWVKSLHIIFMVTWFAGLFYLPRLFVYHALSIGAAGGGEGAAASASR